MDALLRDLRFAARTLARAPGFTLVAVATLGLGIGANAAVFGIVDAVLLRPLPFDEPERLVSVRVEASDDGGTDREGWGPEGIAELRAQPGLFEAIGGWARWSPTLTELGDPAVLRAARVTAGMLDAVLRVEPVLGRAFTPDEDLSGAAGAVLLGHGFWLDRFGGDRSVLGRLLVLDDEPYAVVGVMPQGFEPPFAPEAEVWAAARLEPSGCGRRCSRVAVVGRLAEGVSFEVAGERASALAARLGMAGSEASARLKTVVTPLREDLVGGTRHVLWMLMGAVGIVLLVACTNVAALLLFRGTGRREEFAIRAALGAGRGRILRQLVVEGLLLAFLGGLVGLALASWGADAMIGTTPLSPPSGADVGVHRHALAFTATLALGTGLVIGLLPGLSGGRGERSRRRRAGPGIARSAVVCQIALATVLLVGSGLLLRSLERLSDAELGFDPEGVLTVQLALPMRLSATAARASLLESVLERLEATRGVRSAAVAAAVPFVEDGPPVVLRVEEERGSGADDAEAVDVVRVRPVSRGYFYTIGQRIVAGREFEERDAADGAPVAIVGERFAERRLGYPRRDATGARVALGVDPQRWHTVVGVASDTRHLGPRDPERDVVYVPVAQSTTPASTLLVRTDADPADVVAGVRAAVSAAGPGLAASAVAPMVERAEARVVRERVLAHVVGVFSVLSLLLAAVGLYGVVSLAVVRRMRELSIRLALGADREAVRRLVMRTSMATTLLGVALGAAGALVLGRLIRSFLFGVAPTDPTTLAGATAVLIAVAVVASRFPVERAGRADPARALRE